MSEPLPLNYRQAEAETVLRCLGAGESATVFGPSGTGKSNFARFLARPDVVARHLGVTAPNLLTVLVDSHSLAGEGGVAWQVYELMIHRLLATLPPAAEGESGRQELEALYRGLLETRDTLLGQRYLERCVHHVVHNEGRRVAFLLDDFDEPVRAADRQLFLGLRAIRDELKYDLTYVLFTRLELARLRPEPTDIQAFAELVDSLKLVLGPYAQADAEDLVGRLARRWHVDIPPPLAQQIIDATGAHPGLLRAAVHVVAGAGGQDAPMTAEDLIRHDIVGVECERLLEDLTDDERWALQSLAIGRPSSQLEPATLSALEMQYLVVDAEGTPRVFASVLARFLHENPTPAERQIEVDEQTVEVTVDGRPAARLTPLEFQLLAYLYQHRGVVCSRDAIIGHLYPRELSGDIGIADNRVDTLVARVRRKIEPNSLQPRLIKTVRGRGYMLVGTAVVS